MLSASASRATPKSCPSCRIHLASLLENGFTRPPQRPDASSLLRRLRRPTSASNRIIPNSPRFLTTSAPRSSEPQGSPPAPSPSPRDLEDMERIVRQARHAFGVTLPKDYLNAEEYKIYERLYGPPVRETEPGDVAFDTREFSSPSGNALYRETEHGQYEQVPYWQSEPLSQGDPEAQADGTEVEFAPEAGASLPGIEYIKAVAKNDREYDALLKLQRDFEIAASEEGFRESEAEEAAEKMAAKKRDSRPEVREEDEFDEDEEDEDRNWPLTAVSHGHVRSHEWQRMARWNSFKQPDGLPQIDMIGSIKEQLQRTDIKHIRETAEKVYGGRGLPDSVGTPHGLGNNKGQRPVAQTPGQSKMTEIEADAYMASNLPGMYTTVESILVEIRKRLGPKWMENLCQRADGEGPRVLDVGAGGAGLAAWQNVLHAEWEAQLEAQPSLPAFPPGKKTVVVGSDALRHRISRFLENTTFLPRLPDYLHSRNERDIDASAVPQQRKQFDVIIAAHNLMPKVAHRRKAFLDNLWEMLSPEGGVLIMIEKAHPRGFEAIADVRSRLINEFILPPKLGKDAPASAEAAVDDAAEGQAPTIEDVTRAREPGAIVAPCTNHDVCPMYTVPGTIIGRKDFCSFQKRFHRPNFMQHLHGQPTGNNHEDIGFSFIAAQRGIQTGKMADTGVALDDKPAWVERGPDSIALRNQALGGYEHNAEAPNPHTLPRTVRPPLKRRGHVVLDVCTPSATLERWTVPKSFSSQAYRDARKVKWGDLWALGAKTSVPITVRYGRGGAVPDDGGVRAQRAKEATNARTVVNATGNSRGILKAREANTGRGHINERRTKGGRKPRQESLMDELKD